PLNLRNNQATQQLNSEPNQATQQLNSESNQPPQQLNTRPTKIIQQLNSEPNQITHQLNSEPNQVTQQAHFIPIGFKQREYFNPIEFKHQLYLKSKEAEYAEYIMAEALDTAKKHAIHTNDYNLYYNKGGVFLHFKRVNDTDIGKLEFTIPNANNYGDIVKMLWDPNGEKGLNTEFIEGKVSRMYSKNLSIIQRRYKGDTWNRYYYAMANKVEVSRDETVILLVSSDMNDHSGFDFDDYINSIVESANSFTPDMDSEEDIREGKLAKFYINLIAFFIKKRPTDVKITHLSSIDHEIPTDDPEKVFRQMTANSMLDIVKLRDIFKVTNPFPYGIF
ncbi:fam-a protein, partial [Plasmodium chabaudi chabaudi]